MTNPSFEDHALVMNVNYDGIVYTVSAATAAIVKAKGAIVLIGTQCIGSANVPPSSLDPVAFQSNMIAPGTIQTPMYAPEKLGPEAMAMDAELRGRTPIKRIGTADEVANVARLLLSDDASYITGAVIVVDGGLTV
ncbi:hypothetical protein LTR10_023914 [Elasticomyces elasticus]|uniref:Uncharacterized protein n=1 Tax=Exophiala sideris TaxID=1016849 RepID=A0ABR0IUA7_9EURO|nr:hypothetical protein LTR10_023914 [Elasticomyces elasticus]KAK5020875.1 hypothetical protein LTS07_011377 [Exophiala sideris]KAK5023000.1 hypothetical protein LTR13_011346 [Exophiala sideris]KAK5048412.1 hypothetical protein LTR69_011400 [Exophiala sideris]KAK5176081.1 hypothetical protein LTR44_011356 [Eurotiomycetes sp. CCFEE 6388]